jgi:hypothetical protein
MKKSELKNIIKECVKEVIFEEGVLSGIITEVAQGLTLAKRPAAPSLQEEAHQAIREDTKRQVLSAIGKGSTNDLRNQLANPGLFEGTTPIAQDDGRGPFSGVNPDDPGVNLNNIPGLGTWAAMAAGKRK